LFILVGKLSSKREEQTYSSFTAGTGTQDLDFPLLFAFFFLVVSMIRFRKGLDQK